MLRRNFIYFIFLSVVLHAGIASWLISDKSLPATGSTITVSLLPPNNHNGARLASRQSISSKSKQATLHRAIQKMNYPNPPKSLGQPNLSFESTPARKHKDYSQESYDKTDARPSKPGSVQALRTGNILRRMLQKNMTQFFHYPRNAMKNGWQGKVTIGIRIEPDGYISQTRLVNSSGYSTLDLAALEGARKVKSLPDAIALLNGRAFDLLLPVIYRLQDT